MRLVAVATRLCGPAWLVGPTAALRREAGGADGAGAADGAGVPTSEAPTSHDGSLLSLVLQLCSVELQLCLHDQPAEEVSATCLGVLPACCALLEEALFRLHSDSHNDDGDDDDMGTRAGDGGGSDGGAASGGDVWLNALDDAQLLSVTQAFRRAMMASLEFLEAINTEQADARAAAAPATAASPFASPAATAATAAAARAAAVDVMGEDAVVVDDDDSVARPAMPSPSHPLVGPAGRLVSAWMAQPSAAELLELYDRACHLLPLLRSIASDDPHTLWASHLESFERREPSQPREEDDGSGEDAPAHETMAELFERLIPKDAEAREGWGKWAQKQKAAMGAMPVPGGLPGGGVGPRSS